MAASVFDAAAKALERVEVDRRAFGSGRRFHDDQLLVIGVGPLIQFRRSMIAVAAEARASDIDSAIADSFDAHGRRGWLHTEIDRWLWDGKGHRRIPAF